MTQDTEHTAQLEFSGCNAVYMVTFTVARNRRIHRQTQGLVTGNLTALDKFAGQATVPKDVDLIHLWTISSRGNVFNRRRADSRQAVEHAEFLGGTNDSQFPFAMK